MFTTNFLMAMWLATGPELELHIEGSSECNGKQFSELPSGRCPHPIGPIEVRFYENDDGFCADVDGLHVDCSLSCVAAHQQAAMSVDESVYNACQPSPTEPVDLVDAPVQLMYRRMVRPSRIPISDFHVDLSISSVAFVGDSSDPIGSGFRTALGLNESGMRFALIVGMIDVTRSDWFWRLGLEVCRGWRSGRWEFNTCGGMGGGEFYTGPTDSREYPWTSGSQRVDFHVTEDLSVQLDMGAQVAMSDQEFGIRLDPQSKFNNVFMLGIQQQIPMCRQKRGASCR